MTFPIGTFSANERPSNTNAFAVNGDVFSTSNVPPNLAAVSNSQYNSNTTSNATDSNAANQGIRETGIIEKLLVSILIWGLGFLLLSTEKKQIFWTS